MNRRLQIGMWESFDLEKWNRWQIDRIAGMEISMFENVHSLVTTKEWCEENDISLGVHAPVLRTETNELPRLTSRDKQEQAAAWAEAEKQIALAAHLQVDYVLFHYPYPSLFPSELQLPFHSLLRRFNDHEWEYVDGKEWREHTDRLFDQLCEWQSTFKLRIVLELDFFAQNGEVIVEAFARYPDLQLVFDTSRWDINRRATGMKKSDSDGLLKALAPYVYLVHYSNVRYRGLEYDNHLPDLPEYGDDPDYGDSFAYLQALALINDRFHVTFEHKADSITREQLLSIYERTASLLY